MLTKIYSYGCKRPDAANRAVLDANYRLSHEYYNKLVEIERAKRAAVREAQLSFSDRLAKATAEIERLDAELEENRAAIRMSKSRDRKGVDPTPMRNRAKEIRARLKVLYQESRDARTALRSDPNLRNRLAEIEAETDRSKKAAYAASPLFWGSKNHVAQRIELACRNSKDEIRFRRWNRDGVLYCQVMHGIDVETLYAGTDGKVRVTRLNHKKLCRVQMRVGSNPDRTPIFVTVEAYIHRPFPEGAKITGVQIARREGVQYRMTGGKYEYVDDHFVQFTVQFPEPERPVPDQDAVAVDLGWRLKGDGSLRVAATHDTAGNDTEFTLPRNLLDRWTKCRDLQSIRDRLFNESIKALQSYVASGDRPDFVKAVAPHLHLWKSPHRLARFVDFWQRHPGDDAIYGALFYWRDREAHLYQWQRNNETKAQRIRLDMFRVWARKLARTYKTVVMEDMNIAELRRTPNPEDKPSDVIVHWRNAAAIGLLRSVVTQAAGETALMPTVRTTMNCHSCGGVNNWDRRELDHTCRHCGVRWDQDENAAKNLLQSFLTSRGTQPQSAPPDDGSPKGRWQRRKANRSQPGAKGSDVQQAADPALANNPCASGN